ncbi:CBS domain-containing protein [Blastopirellula sp. JC733]|nr:CBS domain-containing protein [Blastopirellula sediminis]
MPSLDTISEKLSGAVRDVMTVKVHTATVGTHVKIVAGLMARHNLRRIIVVDDKKRVIGVVSQRDVVRSMMKPEEADELPREIQQLITRERPVTVSPEVPLAKAALVLATNKIGCLPVVGLRQELRGVLSTSDLIQHLADVQEGEVENSFRMYSPMTEAKVKIPAYIRKVNGDLVIPMNNIKNRKARLDRVVLGYDPPSSRILVKFVRGTVEDAIATKIADNNLVIPAHGFVRHFDLIGKSSAFDVVDHNDSKFLVLTPRQSGDNAPPAAGST